MGESFTGLQPLQVQTTQGSRSSCQSKDETLKSFLQETTFHFVRGQVKMRRHLILVIFRSSQVHQLACSGFRHMDHSLSQISYHHQIIIK